MKVSKKTVETVSIRLTEAEVRRILIDAIKAHGHDVKPDQINIRRGDEGELEVSVEVVTETGDALKPKRKTAGALFVPSPEYDEAVQRALGGHERHTA